MAQSSIMGNIKKGAPGPGAYDIKPAKNNIAYSIRIRTNIYGIYFKFLNVLINFYSEYQHLKSAWTWTI